MYFRDASQSLLKILEALIIVEDLFVCGLPTFLFLNVDPFFFSKKARRFYISFLWHDGVIII